MADRFDEAAKTLIQQLSIAGESFNDLAYVEQEIAAALRAVVPEGFVVAPREATPEMIEAGMDADTREWRRGLGRLPTVEEAQANDYRAMIEARPR